MKTTGARMLAAKVALGVALAAAYGATPVRAGIPVIDVANLQQTLVSALENVSQTLKQVQQYRTQLQQYENMLQNTVAPAAFVWDKATATMDELRGAIDTLAFYKRNLGSIDAYLSRFQDVNHYRGSPCFAKGGCTPAEAAAMQDGRRLASEAQKKANDALFRGLDRQQEAMQADARQLQRLQSGAQGASGQMQALGFANQLASQQANQLLQIRGLLIAQQNAVATRQQALVDQEARAQVADEEALKGTYVPSTRKGY